MKELSGGATVVDITAFDRAQRRGMTVPSPELLLATILSLEDIPHLPFYKEVNAELFAMERAFQEADLILQIFRDSLLQFMEREEQKKAEREDDTVQKNDPRFRAILESADELATGEKITCLDLMAAIFLDPTPLIKDVVEFYHYSPFDLASFCRLYKVGPPMEKRQYPTKTEEPVDDEKFFNEYQPKQGSTRILERYGRDLTALAAAKKLDPLIGRRDILLQVIQTLGRENKNNPILVGEPGVGKTAIVEGLAIRVADGKDPQVLAGKRIFQVNISSLLAGCVYRGQFEQKLEKLMEEARLNPGIILFFDELHTMIGAGRAEGAKLDAANILKPALSRGDIRIIGATTFTEYNQYIESDEAFSRRFEKILVPEPGREETIEILRGLRANLEKHHGIPISDAALQAAVEMSEQFDKNHQLPDKAIDLIDKAAVRVRVPVLSGSTSGTGPVTEETIAEVLAEKTGIPLSLITGFSGGRQHEKILDLEKFLKTRVVGQDAAVEMLCRRLKIAYAGLLPRERPVGVFLFMGPSGVGKTEMAKAVAEYLFFSDASLIRFDMSEFMERESITRLIGAPPGYTGSEAGGVLVDALRNHPFCVVLLDEIEKAHPQVLDLFLQLFGEGRITDSRRQTADATNAIIIMTSNLQVNPLLLLSGSMTIPPSDGDTISQGSTPPDRRRIPKAPPFFRTEFLNRIDEIIVFNDLDKKDLSTILEQVLNELVTRVIKKQNVRLVIDDEVFRFLLVTGFSEEFGVRELQRIAERYILAPLSDMILTGRIQDAPVWEVRYTNGQIVIVPGADTN